MWNSENRERPSFSQRSLGPDVNGRFWSSILFTSQQEKCEPTIPLAAGLGEVPWNRVRGRVGVHESPVASFPLAREVFWIERWEGRKV